MPAAWIADPGGTPATDPFDQWVATFGDAQLPPLVDEALENNTDLRVSAARVERAAAEARLAGAHLWPQSSGRELELAANSDGRLEEGVATGAAHGRLVGTGSVGTGSRRPRGRARAVRVGRGRSRLRPAVDCRRHGARLVPRHRGRPAGAAGRGSGSAVRRCPPPRRATADAGICQRPRRGARPRPRVARPGSGASPAGQLRAGGAKRRDRDRTVSGCRDRRRHGPARPSAARADRPAVGAARAAARRHRRRAPRQCRVLQPRRSQGGASAAHRAHRRHRHGLSRRRRATERRRQSDLGLRHAAAGADLHSAAHSTHGSPFAPRSRRRRPRTTPGSARARLPRSKTRWHWKSICAIRSDTSPRPKRDAAETVRLARIRFDVGQIALSELLLEQAQLVETRAQLARVRGQLLTNRVDLHLALGGRLLEREIQT